MRAHFPEQRLVIEPKVGGDLISVFCLIKSKSSPVSDLSTENSQVAEVKFKINTLIQHTGIS